MDSDFNTVEALKSVFEVSNGVNKYLSLTKTPSEGLLLKALDFYKIIGEIFGLFENYFKESSESDEEEFVKFLIELRSDVRLQKNYEMSDKIRDGLKNLGYQIEDNPKEGTVFKKINI